MNDFRRLLEIILSDTYKITTRTTKYILSLQTENLYHLIEQVTLRERCSILNELVSKSYENKYNKIELYKSNLKILKLRAEELKKNNQINN
jgi:hypothetical protein